VDPLFEIEVAGEPARLAARQHLDVTQTGMDTTYLYVANDLSELSATAMNARLNLGIADVDTVVFRGIDLISPNTGAAALTLTETPITVGRSVVMGSINNTFTLSNVEVDSSLIETATTPIEIIQSNETFTQFGDLNTITKLADIEYPSTANFSPDNYVMSSTGNVKTEFKDPNTLIHSELGQLVGDRVESFVVTAGGTGYVNGETATIDVSSYPNPYTWSSGTSTLQIQLAVTAGAVTGGTILDGGSYHNYQTTAVPIISVGGTGATIDLTMAQGPLLVDHLTGNISLGNTAPNTETLNLAGSLTVGASLTGSTPNGSIQYNGVDIEGRVLGNWRSLTNQLATQAWMNIAANTTSTLSTTNSVTFVEATQLATTIIMKSIINPNKIDADIAYSITNVSGNPASIEIRRCEAGNPFSAGTVVRQFSIPATASIGTIRLLALDQGTSSTSVTYRMGIKVANASDLITINPTNNPGPSVIHVTEYQPSSLQLIDLANLGAGAQIWESTTNNIGRLRTITNIDGHMTISQLTDTIDIGIDVIDGGTY